MMNNVVQKTGIFAFSLLAAFSAVYLYSPVISSHAETVSGSLEVNAEIRPLLSIESDSEMVEIVGHLGTFVHGDTTVSVDTNSGYGYSLMLEDLDLNSDLVNQSAAEYKMTSSFSGSKTEETMEAGSWGYTIDGGSNYYSVPTYGNSVRIKSTNTSSINVDETVVGFGAKLGTSLPAGHYVDYVLFTAVANGQDGNPYETPSPAMTMQGFDLYPAPGQKYFLTDTRNNKVYEVRSDNYGDYWMTENLDLTGVTINSDDSAIYDPDSDEFTFTIPSSLTTWSFSYDTPEVYETNIPGYGTYYNYAAASANYNVGDYADEVGNICPFGWHIPTVSEWQSVNDLSVLNLGRSGMYSVENGVTGQGTIGAWWALNGTASAEDANELSAIFFNDDGIRVSNDVDGKNGLGIRCIRGYYSSGPIKGGGGEKIGR